MPLDRYLCWDGICLNFKVKDHFNYWHNSNAIGDGATKPPAEDPQPESAIALQDEEGSGAVLRAQRASICIQSFSPAFVPMQEWAIIKISVKNIALAGNLVLQIRDKDQEIVYAERLSQNQVFGLPSVPPATKPPLWRNPADTAEDEEEKAEKRGQQKWATMARGPYTARILVTREKVGVKKSEGGMPGLWLKVPPEGTPPKEPPEVDARIELNSTFALHGGVVGALKNDQTGVRFHSLQLGRVGVLRKQEAEELLAKAKSWDGTVAPDKDLIRWVRARLNELGYYAGSPIGTRADKDELARAIGRYRQAHPGELAGPMYVRYDPADYTSAPTKNSPKVGLLEVNGDYLPLTEDGKAAIALIKQKMESRKAGAGAEVASERSQNLDDTVGKQIETFTKAFHDIDKKLVTALLAKDDAANAKSIVDDVACISNPLTNGKLFVDHSRFYIGQNTEFSSLMGESERAARRKFEVENAWLSRPVLPLGATVMIHNSAGVATAAPPETLVGCEGTIDWSWSDEAIASGAASGTLPAEVKATPNKTKEYFEQTLASVGKNLPASTRNNARVELGGIITGNAVTDASAIFLAHDPLHKHKKSDAGAQTAVSASLTLDAAADGHSAVLFSPSHIAGDNYKVKATFKPPATYAFAAPAPETLSQSTGRMTIWRRIPIAAYIKWGDYKARDIPWAEVAKLYQHAFLHVDPPRASLGVADLGIGAAFATALGKVGAYTGGKVLLPAAFYPDTVKLNGTGGAGAGGGDPYEIINLLILGATQTLRDNWASGKVVADDIFAFLFRMFPAWTAAGGWVAAVAAHFKTELEKTGKMVAGAWSFAKPAKVVLAPYAPGGVELNGKTRLEILTALLVPKPTSDALVKYTAGTLVLAADQVKAIADAQKVFTVIGGKLDNALEAVEKYKDGTSTSIAVGTLEDSLAAALKTCNVAALDKLGAKKPANQDQLNLASKALYDDMKELADKVETDQGALLEASVKGALVDKVKGLQTKNGTVLSKLDDALNASGTVDEQTPLRLTAQLVNALSTAKRNPEMPAVHPLIAAVVSSLNVKAGKIGAERDKVWQTHEVLVTVSMLPTVTVLPNPGNTNEAGLIKAELLKLYTRVDQSKVGGKIITFKGVGLKVVDANAKCETDVKAKPGVDKIEYLDKQVDLTPDLGGKSQDDLHGAYASGIADKKRLAVMNEVSSFIAEATDVLCEPLDLATRKILRDRKLSQEGLVVVDMVCHEPLTIDAKPYYVAPASLGKSNGVTFIARGMPVQDHHLVAHEMAHCMFHGHWQRNGKPGVTKDFSVKLDHDQGDRNCVMSYPAFEDPNFSTASHYHPDNYQPQFCGKCNLKLRGWDLGAKKGVEPLLPISSTGHEDFNSDQPIPRHPKITKVPELPSGALVTDRINDLISTALGMAVGEVDKLWKPKKITDAGAISVLANPQISDKNAGTIVWKAVDYKSIPDGAMVKAGDSHSYESSPAEPAWSENMTLYFTMEGLSVAGPKLLLNMHAAYGGFTDNIHEAWHFLQQWDNGRSTHEGITDLFAYVTAERIKTKLRADAQPQPVVDRFTYGFNASYAESVLHAVDQWLPRLGFANLVKLYAIAGSGGLLTDLFAGDKGATYAAFGTKPDKTGYLDTPGNALIIARDKQALYVDTTKGVWPRLYDKTTKTFRPDIETAIVGAGALKDEVRATLEAFFAFLEAQLANFTPARKLKVPAFAADNNAAHWYTIAQYARLSRKHASYTSRYREALYFKSIGATAAGLDDRIAEWKKELEDLSVNLADAPLELDLPGAKPGGYFS